MVGVYRLTNIKRRHKAAIWGMFVQKEHRGCGAGRLLLEEALRAARAMPGSLRRSFGHYHQWSRAPALFESGLSSLGHGAACPFRRRPISRRRVHAASSCEAWTCETRVPCDPVNTLRTVVRAEQWGTLVQLSPELARQPAARARRVRKSPSSAPSPDQHAPYRALSGAHRQIDDASALERPAIGDAHVDLLPLLTSVTSIQVLNGSCDARQSTHACRKSRRKQCAVRRNRVPYQLATPVWVHPMGAGVAGTGARAVPCRPHPAATARDAAMSAAAA